MHQVRHILAVSLLLTTPSVLLFWLLIHPFVRFWRKLGSGWTFSLLCTISAGLMAGLFLTRKSLLAVEFGTNYLSVSLGLLCLTAAMLIFRKLRKQLTIRTMIGLPELAPDRHPGRLMTEGIYARIRHPRYVEIALSLLGFTFIANYLATYIFFALFLPGLYLVVILEEQELLERFGENYRDYCSRVPRFIPKFRL